ncbi:MAG: 3-(3-hydroxy-phenyl)propionate/3-hydroxycinnamic acid hydroxylase [Pseudomonadota bacterium]|jgi:3-(3-hydroxy-phenyl)propionate hydroxylase
MHTPSTQPRPSIYYKYQVFKPWLPTQNPPQSKHKVVIVGAGPAGMVTALELARHGVACVLLSADLQFSQGSRAIVFTRRSMEILQQVGVAHRITENGLPWRCGHSIYRGQKVFRMETPHDPDDRFFPMINIQQQYLEEYLHDACAANELIEVRWGNKLVKAENMESGVKAEIDTPEGPYTLDTEWLVAADGGRSEIRSSMNLKLEGASFESIFVIADIRIDLPYPTERLAFFDPDWNRGNTILMHREPHGIWRVDYQLPPGETPEEALRPESLKQRIDAQLKMIGFEGKPWEMDWNSVYSARTLTLPEYVHKRIVFTGDAAHLLPIFGVRGANTAFQDAQSLGWHLAYVVEGHAPEQLMQNHSTERVGAAREIITEAGKSTRFMAPPSRGFRLLRDAVLSLSLTQEFVRPLYHWRTSRPHAYSHSLLNSPCDDNTHFKGGPAVGAPPQNVQLQADDYLLDHLGGGFDLVYVAGEQGIPSEISQAVAGIQQQGIPLQLSVISAQAKQFEGANQTLHDPQQRFTHRYAVQVGGAYLFRPDQHICARWQQLDAARLQQSLQVACMQ